MYQLELIIPALSYLLFFNTESPLHLLHLQLSLFKLVSEYPTLIFCGPYLIRCLHELSCKFPSLRPQFIQLLISLCDLYTEPLEFGVEIRL